MSFLLDTNVVSEWTKPKPDAGVVAWLESQASRSSYLSTASWAELRRGIENLDDGARKARLLSWLNMDMIARFDDRLIVIDRGIAERWGALVAQARRQGIGLSAIDAFIAATALANNLTLVTRNIRDFEPLGVPVFNPWAA